MNARRFNLICIVAIVVVGIVAVAMVELSPNGKAIESPKNVDLSQFSSAGANATNPLMPQPMSLNLALAVILDIGLMTLGLVILFQDGPVHRTRVR